MARIEPLRAVRYEPATAGPLERLIAPPYDVIDDDARRQLLARSHHNVVAIDLPEAADGDDPYQAAHDIYAGWQRDGILVREERPALWALTQDYTGPDGRPYTRHGFLCRVRVEDYGAGRIRPHERTHPEPKQDRLRLTRATQANLSPIFSLYPDPDQLAWAALEPGTRGEPRAAARDDDGTLNRLWAIDDAGAIEAVQAALAESELLIADGHHRYETARAYADEIGGEGEHRYVLMYLCSLADSGLTIFPTHRLLSGLDEARRERLRETIERDFEVTPLASPDELEPPAGTPGVAFGYLEAANGRPVRLTLRSQDTADAALAGRPEPFRRLDTAVLEAIVLEGALGMSEDDISHLRGLAYSKDFADARAAVESGRAEAAFFMRATPVAQVQEVAATGESMPPKSTYFYPKVPTGLLFNPLA
ncbi:MAG: DUF1015 domain-containing protein [Thermoleophilaceae bacterium]|nr:DUF1015 domain-containing protein [Thermoleophilaceae bacterium]